MISDLFEILLLSLIQGVSEFLPISSAAHLILASNIYEFKNQSLLIDISLHLGSLLAILFYFRNEIFNLKNNLNLEVTNLIKSIYKMFLSTDASLVEINPLILTSDQKIVCLDAKINFDDNSLYRHPEILELRDLSEENPTEVEASKHDLAYIKLDGSIGCMVNGAGLAMATMDIIKLYGKEPANFLDVGGGASKEKVSSALKIILSDKNVKGILINIFGGIMRCDVLDQGVVDAAKEIKIKVPLVVRLAGTNFLEGKKILDDSGLKLISAENLDDAAKKIVEAIK